MLFHVESGHTVGYKLKRYAVGFQLPGCQARALQQRPRFAGNNINVFAAVGCRADHAKGCAVAARGKSARIADGHNGG